MVQTMKSDLARKERKNAGNNDAFGPIYGTKGAFSALFDALVPGLGTIGAPANDVGPPPPEPEQVTRI